jgi:hypothetical protein
VLDIIAAAVARFAAGAAPEDDLTLLAIKYRKAQTPSPS